jgi:tripartite-type tricarboxylate transporter receptor subunit TctC
MSCHRQRRGLLIGLAGATVLVAAAADVSSPAAAQPSYPSRPIRLVVPYTPGTTADTLARLLGSKLEGRWKVATVTENKPGASGIIGTDAVAKAAPDGYTLLFTATAHGTVGALHKKLPFDTVKSFTPVALLATSALALCISPQLPVSTVGQFLELARSQPGKVRYSSPGTGGPQHLAMELFELETGTDLLHVPYKGSAGALSDLVAGHVDASVVSLQSSAQFVNSGKLKMLAVMSDERSPAFPNVPTLKESGHAKLVVDTWYGVFAPAGTPANIVGQLNRALNETLQLPDVREAFAKQGLTPAGGPPRRLSDLVAVELSRWIRVVGEAKISED